MSTPKLYTIEFYMEPPVAKWAPMTPFSFMRKSEAYGAWAMLKSFYNQKRRHRLVCVCNGEIVEEIGVLLITVADQGAKDATIATLNEELRAQLATLQSERIDCDRERELVAENVSLRAERNRLDQMMKVREDRCVELEYELAAAKHEAGEWMQRHNEMALTALRADERNAALARQRDALRVALDAFIAWNTSSVRRQSADMLDDVRRKYQQALAAAQGEQKQ